MGIEGSLSGVQRQMIASIIVIEIHTLGKVSFLSSSSSFIQPSFLHTGIFWVVIVVKVKV